MYIPVMLYEAKCHSPRPKSWLNGQDWGQTTEAKIKILVSKLGPEGWGRGLPVNSSQAST